MPGGSVVTTLTQKRAVFPAFSSREVTLGQMRKMASTSSSTQSRRHEGALVGLAPPKLKRETL